MPSNRNIRMTLSPVDCELVLSNSAISKTLRSLIERKQNEHRSVKISVTFEEKEAIDGILNPHLLEGRSLFAVHLVAVIVSGVLAFSTLSAAAAPTDPGPWPNNCNGWARMLGKEGKVRDSASMHTLGCDDNNGPGGISSSHYRATVDHNRNDICTYDARHYARLGYFGYNNTVVKLVQADFPTCVHFEDGSWAMEG